MNAQSRFVLLDRDDPVIIVGSPFGDLFAARGRVRRPVSGGAVTVSGLYVLTRKKMHDGTDTILDYINDTIKFALFTNAITPNFSSDTGYTSAPYTTNEVTGTAYVAGGVTLGGKTVTESPAGTLMFDATDPAWAGATFSGVRCGLTYDTTIASMAFVLTNFGADYAVTAGTLTVQLDALGLATDDLTP